MLLWHVVLIGFIQIFEKLVWTTVYNLSKVQMSTVTVGKYIEHCVAHTG